VIPLLRGASGKRLRDAPDGDTVLIAEGIENALAAAYLRGDRSRVFAAVSANNFPKLRLPAQLAHVVIVRDNDEANPGVEKTLKETMDLLTEEGHDVEWRAAPPQFKDMAAFLSNCIDVGIVG
jgi:hypothetical protein